MEMASLIRRFHVARVRTVELDIRQLRIGAGFLVAASFSSLRQTIEEDIVLHRLSVRPFPPPLNFGYSTAAPRGASLSPGVGARALIVSRLS